MKQMEIGRTVYVGNYYRGEKEIRDCVITDKNMFYYTAEMKTDRSKYEVFSDKHLDNERRFLETHGEWEQLISTDKEKIEDWLKTK